MTMQWLISAQIRTTKILAYSLFLAHLALTGSMGCSVTSDGYFRRLDTSPVRYEVVADQHAYVYRAAYELCRREHRAGYLVLNQPLPHDGGRFLGRFQCAGEYDPTLALRYEYSEHEFRYGTDALSDRWYFRLPSRGKSAKDRRVLRMNTLSEEPVEKFMGTSY